MKLVADKKGRLTCRELFPPGVSFEAERDPAGAVVLRELVVKADQGPVTKLIRRGGKTFLESDRTLTMDDVAEALKEFPRSICWTYPR